MRMGIRSTCHAVLDATPGQLVFGRDMLLPVQFEADWAIIVLDLKTQRSHHIAIGYPSTKAEWKGASRRDVELARGPSQTTALSLNQVLRACPASRRDVELACGTSQTTALSLNQDLQACPAFTERANCSWLGTLSAQQSLHQIELLSPVAVV
jgi:hypothetical protein